MKWPDDVVTYCVPTNCFKNNWIVMCTKWGCMEAEVWKAVFLLSNPVFKFCLNLCFGLWQLYNSEYPQRRLQFSVNVRYLLSPSVCRLSVCLSSVTFVHPTQPVEILRNVSMQFRTLATHWRPRKILRRSSQGNPSGAGVKCSKRGSEI